MPSLELTNNIYSEYPVQVYALNCIAVLVKIGYTDILYHAINNSIEIISS